MIPEKAKGNIGLVIKGFINAPKDDIYTFALLSDDGSTLLIDGEEVINNGGQLKMTVTGSEGNEIPTNDLFAH